MRIRPTLIVLLVLATTSTFPATTHGQTFEPAAFDDLEYRMVGPYRGGRSTAAVGFLGDPDRWIMGTTGGGIWLSTDNGVSWDNISDGYFGGSIGAVAVATADPNVIYVGMGSVDIRGNTSAGRGVWKSMDGGKTWRSMGLPEAGQIGRIEVHPRDEDLVYVAALGHAFGKNAERGIFRSSDGGNTWQHVLALNDSTGASDLTMNPSNPRELYAGMWRGERKPWTLISGAEEGGVYKTTDGGDSWTKLGGGLPEGMVGKVGVSVSPADPERVWAIVEAEPDGGVYRSDDAGETWTRTNSENNLRQRAWYYTHVQADPQDPNTVYALNTALYRSVDAGRTFESIPVPHGDVHDLWIHPHDPDRMVVADDGGAQVTVNGGRTWSTYYNQATAELYDVIVDNGFPYRLYGAQQDNTTIAVPAWRSANSLYPKQHWTNPGGCETGPIALHPDYPDVLYGGCYGGVIDRTQVEKDQVRNMNLYPQLQLGAPGSELVHRFQWVSPMLVSQHDRRTIYHGSQYVNRSRDEGVTWETLSGDLSTDTPEHQVQSGGPINADVTGVEIFNVVFSIAESPFTPEEVWAGTDDGRLHISRDDGATWMEITPSGMPTLGTVDEIDLSVHAAGRAYVAVHAYRLDDFRPYIFRTDDWGASWRLLTDGANGIPADYPVRTVREDPEREDLLFAGTEFGLFTSFDGGRSWQSLQQNLPITPVTGMRVAHGDLAISTQGRSFWILDDISPLRQMTEAVARADAHLFTPRDAYRVTRGGAGGLDELSPPPAPQGALIDFHLGQVPDEAVRVDVVDGGGNTVRTYATDSTVVEASRGVQISVAEGHNRITWDLFYPGPELPDDAVVWGYTGGVKAPPGRYTVRLTAGDGAPREASFSLLPDPRIPEVTQADYDEQFRVAMQVRDSITQVTRAIETLSSVREQVTAVLEKAEAMGQADQLRPLGDTLTSGATEVHEEMQQTRNRSGQDPIRFPPRLDNQWVELYNNLTGVDGYISGGPEGRPLPGSMQRLDDLNAAWSGVRQRYQSILDDELRRFNEAVERLGLPAVAIPNRARLIS
ncbi:MAG: glycosyl hydrolase [Gemmatimonadota bacterium]|nr:glycosyl hydrolase [Gemmatimonadota bacterium]